MTVTEAFDAIAGRYDTLVGLSPGYHRQLASSARALARAVPAGGSPVIVDLGCGSGASTAALGRALPHARIVGIDASAGMIAAARRKRWPVAVRFLHARAQDLRDVGAAHGADGIFAAYLLRNVPQRQQLMRDLHAALAPGGTLLVHDYFCPASRLGRFAWSALAWGVIIPLSTALTRRPGLFVYLWRSVRDFDDVDTVAAALAAAGFADVRAAPVRGWERFVVHTIAARRPVGSPTPDEAPMLDEP